MKVRGEKIKLQVSVEKHKYIKAKKLLDERGQTISGWIRVLISLLVKYNGKILEEEIFRQTASKKFKDESIFDF